MDKKEDKEFDRLFESAMRKDEIRPSDEVWDNISRDLAAGDERRLGFIWWSRTAAAILLLISFGVSFLPNTPEFANNSPSTNFSNQDSILLAENRSSVKEATASFSSVISNGGKPNKIVGVKELEQQVGLKLKLSSSTLIKRSKIEDHSILNHTRDFEEQLYIQPKTVTELELVERISGLAMNIDQIRTQLNISSEENIEWYTDSKSKSSNNWFAGGAYSADYTSASLNTDQSGFYNNSIGNETFSANGYNVISSRINSAFSTTLNIGHRLTENLEVISGITYSDWEGEQLANYDVKQELTEQIVIPAPAGSSSDVIIQQRTREFNLKDTLQTSFKYQSFEVPLIMRYRLGNNRINYFVSSGLSTNLSSVFKGDNVSEILDGNPQFQKGSNIEPTRLNLLLGVGVGYKLTDQILFKLEPSYSYGLHLRDDPFVKGDFSTWGFGTGLNIFF